MVRDPALGPGHLFPAHPAPVARPRTPPVGRLAHFSAPFFFQAPYFFQAPSQALEEAERFGEPVGERVGTAQGNSAETVAAPLVRRVSWVSNWVGRRHSEIADGAAHVVAAARLESGGLASRARLALDLHELRVESPRLECTPPRPSVPKARPPWVSVSVVAAEVEAAVRTAHARGPHRGPLPPSPSTTRGAASTGSRSIRRSRPSRVGHRGRPPERRAQEEARVQLSASARGIHPA
mmetsp:Transcript_4017/g.9533  ORF Transcript_4017/g.9533 Transcript_4017/m.9533 type:complete len:237 (-) Transcript_4017:38-748(-)